MFPTQTDSNSIKHDLIKKNILQSDNTCPSMSCHTQFTYSFSPKKVRLYNDMHNLSSILFFHDLTHKFLIWCHGNSASWLPDVHSHKNMWQVYNKTARMAVANNFLGLLEYHICKCVWQDSARIDWNVYTAIHVSTVLEMKE